jgi:hypothetical protein
MERFLLAHLSSEAKPLFRKERQFSSETELHFALQTLPSEFTITKIDTKRVCYTAPNELDYNYITKVLHLKQTKPFVGWSVEFVPRSEGMSNIIQVTFFQWLSEIWDIYGSCFPPKPPVMVPHEKLAAAVESPQEYLEMEVGEVLNDYNQEELRHLCYDENIYIILIKLIREDYKNHTETMTKKIQRITEIFEKHKQMKSDVVVYSDRMKQCEAVNKDITETNEKNTREYDDLVRKFKEVKRVISVHFRENRIEWE